MRLFVALVPPADALAELAAAVDALRSTPGLRWTRPEQWHVTLAFLAEVDDRTRDGARPAARAGGAPARPAHAGAGGRRPVRRAGAVDAGGRRPGRRCAGSPTRCGPPLAGAGCRPTRGPTVPTSPSPARVARRPTSRRSPRRSSGFAGRPWTASDLHLVRSVLGVGPGGTAHHEPLASWPLIESIVKVHLAWVVPALRRGHDPRPWPGSTSTSTIRTRRRSTGLVVVVYAIVRDRRDRVLLVRRTDDGNWELPGGASRWARRPPKPSAGRSSRRAGITIALTGVSGIYSDPAHIVVYPVEGARQQVAVCVHARPARPGELAAARRRRDHRGRLVHHRRDHDPRHAPRRPPPPRARPRRADGPARRLTNAGW